MADPHVGLSARPLRRRNRPTDFVLFGCAALRPARRGDDAKHGCGRNNGELGETLHRRGPLAAERRRAEGLADVGVGKISARARSQAVVSRPLGVAVAGRSEWRWPLLRLRTGER